MPTTHPLRIRDAASCIRVVRGTRVVLDEDLARLYGVTTKRLNQSVSRNLQRFPTDFMFRLSKRESDVLRSQTVTSKAGRGGRRHLPRAFTEQGIAMLSGVLRSSMAVAVNIEIMRAFVLFRRIEREHGELAHRIDELERRFDARFRVIFDAIRDLRSPPALAKPERRSIGFRPRDRS